MFYLLPPPGIGPHHRAWIEECVRARCAHSPNWRTELAEEWGEEPFPDWATPNMAVMKAIEHANKECLGGPGAGPSPIWFAAFAVVLVISVIGAAALIALTTLKG